jgi:putative nucleotidyltransferase with HDIG domain
VMRRIRSAFPQPAAAVTLAGLACLVLCAAWLPGGPASARAGQVSAWVLALALGACVLLTQHFPIHVRSNGKINMATVPLYLMSVLLPLPLALTACLAGVVAGELTLRKSRGGYYSDVATQVGRWVLIVAVGWLTFHWLNAFPLPPGLSLVAAGVALWATDMLSVPLLLCPITGESPHFVVAGMVREGGALEAGQYLVGILGAIAAEHVTWSLVLLALPVAMVYSTGKRAKEMRDNTREILESMADTVDLRDPYTGGHTRRVTENTAAILRELGIRGPDAELMIAAARLHDIGKIGMPDSVLLKDGPLTDEEWAIMKDHPVKGAEILTRYPDFARGVDIIRHHHERWDGRGYPDGIRGHAIPFGARVIAVADSFDAMTSDRPYRSGMAVEKAAAILWEGRDAQWEGGIVDAFLRTLGTGTIEPSASVPVRLPEHDTVTRALGA